MTKLLQFRARTCQRSFTLMEMVLVLAIMGGLIVLAINGYFTVVQSSALTTGADMISDALSEGRSSAVAQNTTVEVRFYDVSPVPNASPAYCALQLHWLRADGTTPPVANPIYLSSWIAIDATPTHSPLIGANGQVATPDATDALENDQTRVFHFLADGSTDLNPATNWFFTVRAATQSDPARFPANWASVAVDATTGRVQVYRP